MVCRPSPLVSTHSPGRAGHWVLLGANSFWKFLQCYSRSSNGTVVWHVYYSAASKHEIAIVGPDDNLRSKIAAYVCRLLPCRQKIPGTREFESYCGLSSDGV